MEKKKLQDKIEDLALQIATVKCQVYEAVRSFYSNTSSRSIEEAITFATGWKSNSDCKSDLVDEMDTLHETLVTTLSSLQVKDGNNNTLSSSSSAHGQYGSSYLVQQRLTSQISSSNAILVDLRIIVRLDDRLNDFESYMEMKNLVDAALVMKGIEQEEAKLHITPKNEKDSEHSIMMILRGQMLKGKTRLLYAISEMILQMYSISSKNSTGSPSLVITTISTGVTLADLWTAMEICGNLEEKMKTMASDIKDVLLKPLLSTSALSLEGLVVEVEGSKSTLLGKRSGSTASTGVNLKKVCTSLIIALDFIYRVII